MLRREYGKAINHIRAGIGIFAERSKRAGKPGESKLVSAKNLENMLRHLETHLCELSVADRPSMPRRSLIGRQALPQDAEDWGTPPLELSLPAFANIGEARLELEGYWHNLMFILHELAEPDVFATTLTPEDFTSHCQTFRQAFARWRTRFDKLMEKLEQRLEPLKPAETRALAQLELYQLSGAQILETCLPPNEMNWDRFLHGFERMLDLCDIICGNANDGTDNSAEYGGFQLDHGIVAACLHTVWKCRSARVRLRALKMLSQQRQEGLWDAQLVEMVGRHIDEIERGPGMLEEAARRDALPEEIPVWRRVLGIGVLFSSAGRDAVITTFVQESQFDERVIATRKTMSW